MVAKALVSVPPDIELLKRYKVVPIGCHLKEVYDTNFYIHSILSNFLIPVYRYFQRILGDT